MKQFIHIFIHYTVKITYFSINKFKNIINYMREVSVIIISFLYGKQKKTNVHFDERFKCLKIVILNSWVTSVINIFYYLPRTIKITWKKNKKRKTKAVSLLFITYDALMSITLSRTLCALCSVSWIQTMRTFFLKYYKNLDVIFIRMLRTAMERSKWSKNVTIILSGSMEKVSIINIVAEKIEWTRSR